MTVHTYTHRGVGKVVLNLTMDREAAALLRQWAPGGRDLGRFMARLIYAEQARREERQRLQETLMTAFSGDDMDKARQV
jgi:hypothetical protein